MLFKIWGAVRVTCHSLTSSMKPQIARYVCVYVYVFMFMRMYVYVYV